MAISRFSSPHVEPVAIRTGEDGAVVVEVIQSVFDLNGQPLALRGHRLKDRTVTRIFHLQRPDRPFDIGNED